MRTEVFRALADDSRREMIATLAREGPRTSSELGAPFAMSASAVSQHLKVLRDAGLVEVRKAGKYRVYGLVPDELDAVARWIHTLERQWGERLDRLESVVARLAAQDREEGGDGRS